MTRTWFVTGCAGGIGQQLAASALAAGDRVYAADLRVEGLRELAATHGPRLRVHALDVTDPAAVRSATAAAVTAFGALDVVVNSAGYRSLGSIEDMSEAEFRRNVEVNLYGVVNVVRAVLPVMREARSGRILTISTIGGRRAQPGLGAYQTAKWAVGGFCEILAREVRPLGIRATLIETGGVRTAWAQQPTSDVDVREEYQETVGRFARTYRDNPDVQRGDPAKIARVLVALTEEPDPPARLLLGSDAAWIGRLVTEARAAEDERWRPLSLSTDLDGLGDFADTEVARMVRP
jgi:NAD(P)-dependent dehydrogenase (short-subunit alcohol dehydrogenase family)